MLSKEEFQNQFSYKVNGNFAISGKPLREAMKFEEFICGTRVYRLLNLLVVEKDDGTLYTHE